VRIGLETATASAGAPISAEIRAIAQDGGDSPESIDLPKTTNPARGRIRLAYIATSAEAARSRWRASTPRNPKIARTPNGPIRRPGRP
jgi:hypothetical protein